MASGLEILGALAAIGQIASQGVDLARRIRRCAKAIKHAEKDVKIFADEVDIFSSNLSNFQRAVKRMKGGEGSFMKKRKNFRLVDLVQRSQREQS